MGIPVWRVTIKSRNETFWGHVGFRPEKNVCLPTQLGACSHPTGCSRVPYWCTIDVRTPWARHGVPTDPPGSRWAPTAARQTPSGTVGPRFIGASPVWAARSSYWRQPGLLYPAWSSQVTSPGRVCRSQGRALPGLWWEVTSSEGLPNSLVQVLSRIHPLAYGGELFWIHPLDSNSCRPLSRPPQAGT